MFQQWLWVFQIAKFLDNPWQTDMQGPIRYSSFTLEHKHKLSNNQLCWDNKEDTVNKGKITEEVKETLQQISII